MYYPRQNIQFNMYYKRRHWKNTCVCETLCLAANKVQKTIFGTKVKVNVTKLFERASLVVYARQIWSLSLSYGSKVTTEVTVDNRQTNKQKGQKQYATIFWFGGIKHYILSTSTSMCRLSNIESRKRQKHAHLPWRSHNPLHLISPISSKRPTV